MTEIMNLREKRVQTWNAAKAFLESHRGNDGMLSAEDDAIYNKMVDDMDRMGKEIARLEKLEALDVEMSRATSKPLTSAPVAAPTEDEAPVSKTGRGTKDYTKNFWRVMRSKSVPHEVMNALQVGTETEGGYLVPDEYERTLVQALEEQNIFRQLAHVIHTSSGDRKIPVVASKGTAQWIDEEAQYPESDDSFGQVSIGAYKLATMIKISEELLNDSVFDMPSYIATEFARRIGAAEEEAFFTGNGTGRPLGILAETGGAQVGVTGAKADAVTFDEVMDLFYSLRSPYRRNAVFIMNDATVKALRKLKNGNGDYIWQPSVTAATPDTILNRPVYTSGFMPTLATGNKTILFGDLGYYWVADREGRSFKRLNELYAPTGQVGFLASQRVDGKLILPEAVKVLQQA
jgi:HK97 family phage major capsid protein|nr:MAG TPA: major capsid protein [Caudoviricetes sp.]